MEISKFREIAGSERKALAHLENRCGIIGGCGCPRCGSDDVYRIEGGKRKRCPSCGYRFTLYSGRWLNAAHISAGSWLWTIKLFEMELTAKKIAEETGVSYPTILKAVTAIRSSIAAATLHGETILRKPAGTSRRPVIYYHDCEGTEITSALPTDRIKILERLEHGHLICSDKTIIHDSLLCDDIQHGYVACGNGHPRLRFYLAYPYGARRYIMERLHKYHGVRDDLLPLYVLEMEFRYNNRSNQLFEMLLESVCRFVPPGLSNRGGHQNAYG